MEELRRGSVRSDTVISFFETGTSIGIHEKHPTSTKNRDKRDKDDKGTRGTIAVPPDEIGKSYRTVVYITKHIDNMMLSYH